MKFFNTLAIITALVSPILATPVPEADATLEKRVSYQFYSYVSLGCPGAANVKRFQANQCIPLPGASSKLATPDGSCTSKSLLHIQI